MKNFLLSLKTQDDLSENTLYECTAPRPIRPGKTPTILYVDTVTDKELFSGIRITEDVKVYENVTPEQESELKAKYKFRNSVLYKLL